MLRLCEKAKTLHEERKEVSHAELAKLRGSMCECELSPDAHAELAKIRGSMCECELSSDAHADLAKMRGSMCECELSSDAHACGEFLVHSSSAVLGSMKLWRLGLVAKSRFLPVPP